MRVVFFSSGGRQVTSSRYRSYFFARALEREGLETRICEPPPRRFGWRLPAGGGRELARLARELLRTRRGDLLYLQRPLQNTPFTYLAAAYTRLFRRRMIFDFCDPLFLTAPRKTRLLARLADAVVVSCEDLAAWARQHNPRVYVVPNSVLPEQIGDRPTGGRAERPVVGWTGFARYHEANLRLLLPALARLERPFTFRLIGTRGADDLVGEFRRLPNLDLEVVDWLEPDEVAAATEDLDVAVLPLEEIAWNGKLVTKLIEYLAAGVPVVASPVGDNRFAIVDGANGFLAATTDEWVDRLDRLLASAELRRRLGEEGRGTASRRFSLEVNGPTLAAIVRRVAGETPAAAGAPLPAPPVRR